MAIKNKLHYLTVTNEPPSCSPPQTTPRSHAILSRRSDPLVVILHTRVPASLLKWIRRQSARRRKPIRTVRRLPAPKYEYMAQTSRPPQTHSFRVRKTNALPCTEQFGWLMLDESSNAVAWMKAGRDTSNPAKPAPWRPWGGRPPPIFQCTGSTDSTVPVTSPC